MAGPITWKNVNAPDFTGAAKIMQTGSEQLNKGLSGLTGLLEQRRDTQVANWDNTKTRNTDDLLAQIQGLKDLQGQEALSNQLTPDYLKQQFGSQVDTKAVLGALGRRDNELMQEETDRYNYEQTGLARTEEPIIGQAKALIAANKHDEARAFIGQSGLRDASKATLYQALEGDVQGDQQYRNGQITFGNTQTLFQQGQEDRRLDQTAETLLSEAYNGAVVTDPVTGKVRVDEAAARAALDQQLNAAGVTGKRYRAAMAELPGMIATNSNLTGEQTKKYKSLSSSTQTTLARAAEDRDQVIAKANAMVPPEEVKAWTDEGYQSKEDAYRYLGENVGEASVFTPDDWAPGKSGKYAKEMAVNTVDEYELELSKNPVFTAAEKAAFSKNPLMKDLLGGTVPGIVVKRAFDATPGHGDEITNADFKAALKKTYRDYIKFKFNELQRDDVINSQTELYRELEDTSNKRLSDYISTAEGENVLASQARRKK